MREATARHAARAQREIDAAANRAKASAPPCRNEVLFPSRRKNSRFRFSLRRGEALIRSRLPYRFATVARKSSCR